MHQVCLIVSSVPSNVTAGDIWECVMSHRWGVVLDIELLPIKHTHPNAFGMRNIIIYMYDWFDRYALDNVIQGKYLKLYYNQSSFWRTSRYDIVYNTPPATPPPQNQKQHYNPPNAPRKPPQPPATYKKPLATPSPPHPQNQKQHYNPPNAPRKPPQPPAAYKKPLATPPPARAAPPQKFENQKQHYLPLHTPQNQKYMPKLEHFTAPSRGAAPKNFEKNTETEKTATMHEVEEMDNFKCTNKYKILDKPRIVFTNFDLRSDLRSKEAIEDAVNLCLADNLCAAHWTFVKRKNEAATWDTFFHHPPHNIPNFPEEDDTHFQIRCFYDATTDVFILEAHRMSGDGTPFGELFDILRKNLECRPDEILQNEVENVVETPERMQCSSNMVDEGDNEYEEADQDWDEPTPSCDAASQNFNINKGKNDRTDDEEKLVSIDYGNVHIPKPAMKRVYKIRKTN